MEIRMLAEWDEIAPASDPGSINVRLADSTHPLDFRVGRDFRGRYLFQLDADGAPASAPKAPKLAGMECELEPVTPDRIRLCLTLANNTDFSNFRLMCSGLMIATSDLQVQQSAEGLSAAIEELHRWQDMLRQRRERLLSRSEIIGLVGELLFLRDVLSPRIGVTSALRCWNGPAGHEQDFVLGGRIFEVKTQVVTSDRRIRISSEDQLDPVQGQIYICNQGVAPTVATDPAARTLRALVDELRQIARTAGVRASDMLEIALLEARYEDRAEYDEEAWAFVDRTLYEVTGDFPRIERADLRTGVEMVKYSIRVSDCLPFAVDLGTVLDEAGA
jgi:hypothetical protein